MATLPVRLLVVDDEEDLELLIRQKFRRRIRKGEFDFVFARNGQEALDKLTENPDIHLVLSDINMPVMDGLALLSKLEDAKPDVQAVIVSAYGDMENIRTAMNRGAFDFVTKPINFDDLEITIEKTLNHISALENRPGGAGSPRRPQAGTRCGPAGANVRPAQGSPEQRYPRCPGPDDPGPGRSAGTSTIFSP